MSNLNKIKAFDIQPSNQAEIIPIYKPLTKPDICDLLKTYPILRILYDGQNIYAWKADMADHTEVSKHITHNERYIGFMIENTQIIPSFESIKDSLLYKFKTEFWKD